MLDLAISEDTKRNGTSVVLTNHGKRLSTDRWPQDSDFQLVAFTPTGRTCSVIQLDELTSDIAKALDKISEANIITGTKPDWLQRLHDYASGSQRSV